ncbi:MAG: hypothetical protein WAR83_14455 [Flavobacteriales bacterium]|nr:hypothetical protein [Flavobacteriales bacterium]
MSTAEFNATRQALLQWIGNTNDERLIHILETFRLSFKTEKTDWWDELSEEDKLGIARGLKDVEEGRVLSSHDFWRELKNGQ